MMSPERAVRVDMVYVQDKSKDGGEDGMGCCGKEGWSEECD